MNDLSEIPTEDLLEEIALRCRPSDRYVPPAWARPVLSACAAEAGITIERLVMNTSRALRPVIWRSVAMALLADQTEATLSEIAGIWGTDHSTVQKAVKRVKAQCPHPNAIRTFLRESLSRLRAHPGHAPRSTAPQVRTGDPRPTATGTRKIPTPA